MNHLTKLLKNSIKHFFTFGPRSTIYKAIDFIKSKINPDTYNENEQYQKWITNCEKVITLENAKKEIQSFKLKPKISILIPVYNIEDKYLKLALDSIINQYYTNWEICIVGDGPTSLKSKSILEEYKKNLGDKMKIEFSPEHSHISVTTNKAFELATGEYVFLMDNDDEISVDCLFEYVKMINKYPNADLIYSDEDKLDMEGKRIEPYFRPDYSPEYLLSMMYLPHSLYRKSFYKKIGMLKKGYEGSQDYDLALRAFESTTEIYHIPKVLFHWRKIPNSTADSVGAKSYVINAAKMSLQDSINRRGWSGKVLNDGYPFRLDLDIQGEPLVEIVIPTKDKSRLLEKLINSILKMSEYQNYIIHIVDNNSVEAKTQRYFNKISNNPNVKVTVDNRKYNFSAINNKAVKESNAEYVLFLNNDTKVLSKGWLKEMLMWAQQDEIGAVGAKLLFANHRIQHAGIVMGFGPITPEGKQCVANHLYYNILNGDMRSFNGLNLVRNVSAVTGACLLISKEKFLKVGGFDESYPTAYNDVDLCLKLLEAGYRNVYTPYATLYHFESVTRIPTPEKEATERIMKKWYKYLKHDPYYNQNFEKETIQSYRIKGG